MNLMVNLKVLINCPRIIYQKKCILNGCNSLMQFLPVGNVPYCSTISLLKNSTALEFKFLIPVDHNLEVPCSKLTCKLIYSVLVKNNQTKPTSVRYWQQKLNKQLDENSWEQIFFMPRKGTIESYTQCLQFEIINNALFLNSQLYRVSHKKVSIKNFYSVLLKASIYSFEFIRIQYICKFCLVYHLKNLDASR